MYFIGQTSSETNHFSFIGSPGARPIYTSQGYYRISAIFRSIACHCSDRFSFSQMPN